jgi:thiol-disulfide isomerase/thioredoxin
MKTKLIFIILCCIARMASAQDAFLHVGDHVPEVAYTASHYPGGKIKLSQLHKKLIILDLWDIYCGGCIEHMPEIAALQKKYDKDIQIIMVSKSKTEAIQKLAARSEFVRENPLPFINGEEKLAGLFNYNALPTHVWLDGTGKVISITDDGDADAQHIERYLAGLQPTGKEKKPLKLKFDTSPLVMQTYPKFGDNFYITSYLAPWDQEHYMTTGFTRNGLSNPGPVKVQNGTETLQTLYEIAYGFVSSTNGFSLKRVILEFNDTAGYAQKSYVYNLIVRRQVPVKSVLNYVRTQFDLTFGVSSSLQRRPVPCLVIKQLPGGLKGQENAVDSGRSERLKDQRLRVKRNWQTFTQFFGGMQQRQFQFIDETGIPPEKIVNIEFSMEFENMEKVRKSLAPYGLTMQREERMLDCVVVKDAER